MLRAKLSYKSLFGFLLIILLAFLLMTTPSGQLRNKVADIPTTITGVQTDLPGLNAAVEKSRYRIRPQQRRADVDTYYAQNPAQELGATFGDRGLSLRSSTTLAPTWQWGMELQGYGYGKLVARVEPAELVVIDNRIEYRRGALTEWYVNEARGLEQGFTLVKAPLGREGSDPLVLDLKVSGELRAKASNESQEVWFVGPGGERVLGYSKLAAFDAEGRRLAARMKVIAETVRLEVDEQDAVYPVMIDPLIFTETHLFASDATEADLFGSSVAISGDTIVVGAIGDDTAAGANAGSAYVYVRSGATWIEQAHLFASDGTAADQFGWSVAISGETIVVGALYHDTTAGGYAGSAYVYVRNGTTWSEQAQLFASDGAAIGLFGSSVAISGETIVVGAVRGAVVTAGSAYVYVRSGTTWSEQAHVFASDARPIRSCDQRRDHRCPRRGGCGSAYVYVRSGTTWSAAGGIIRQRRDNGDDFGQSVAISGDTVVVGAPHDDTPAGRSAGSAYVYLRSGTNWSEQAHLFASDAANMTSLDGRWRSAAIPPSSALHSTTRCRRSRLGLRLSCAAEQAGACRRTFSPAMALPMTVWRLGGDQRRYGRHRRY